MDFNGFYSLLIEEWKLLSLLSFVCVVYFYYTSTFSHFEKKGVKFMKPTIFFGNHGPRITLKKSYHDFQLQIYRYFKGLPYGGVFEGRLPVLYIFDPDLIKAVMIKDFDHFVDRNSHKSREPKYLARNLLNLKGNEWKGVRRIMTPSFSSARLRNMLPLMLHCSSQMRGYLKTLDKKDLEMRDTMTLYTLEVVGLCAFGIKLDSFQNEDFHFVEVAARINSMPVSKKILVFALLMFAPGLFRFLNISLVNSDTCEKLVRLLAANKAERLKSLVKGHDLLQLLIDAAEKEKIEQSEGNQCMCIPGPAHIKRDAVKILNYVTTQTIAEILGYAVGNGMADLDDDTIDAQCLFFLSAGYETSRTLLSFATHVLATKPDLQEKLRKHVHEITEGKEISYEMLAELTYLEAFLLETLRVYPPIPRVDRVCTKKYTFPGTNVETHPGDVVAVPVYGVNTDPDIYPDPFEFRPERFMGDEKNNRPSHLFLSFGFGPRNCIGMRFAMISAKLAIVSLLRNFKLSRCDKTEEPVFQKKNMTLIADLWVHIETL